MVTLRVQFTGSFVTSFLRMTANLRGIFSTKNPVILSEAKDPVR